MRISDWSSDVCSSDLRLRIMKATILDVLLYLFEHYFYDDPDAASDRESMLNGPIFQGLTQAGFNAVEITTAFDWLDALSRPRPQRSEAPPSELPSLMRISYAVFLLKPNKTSQLQIP